MRSVILSYNKINLTRRCVDSVRKYESDDHIILVHNGSEKSIVSELQQTYPHISHLILPTNGGFSYGANQGLEFAFKLDPWATLITNDCELLTHIQPPEDPGFYAPLIYRRALTKIDSLGGIFNPLMGSLRHLRDIDESELILRKIIGKSLFNYFYIPGTSFVIDCATWSKLGGFDESLHTYWEDVDLSMRAHKTKLNLGIHPKLRILHHVGKTCHKKPFYTNYLFPKNRRTVSKRYSPFFLRPFQNLWL